MSYWQKVSLITLCGVIAGGGLYFLYLLRAHTYLGDNPEACINCHIMTPYYATWKHSSHGRDATCNDCHVPHENVARKYFFKGTDGMKHVFAFVTKSERPAPEAQDESAEVIMNNCIRCHQDLTTSMAKVGKMNYEMAKAGEGKACWDCHRDVPHGRKTSLCSTPTAVVPLPESPVPEWLQNIISK